MPNLILGKKSRLLKNLTVLFIHLHICSFISVQRFSTSEVVNAVLITSRGTEFDILICALFIM